MSIVYAAQPGASGATLVFDGSAESRAFRYFNDALWSYFSTGMNPATDTGVAFKTSPSTIDPWIYRYAAYDLTGGSGNDVFTSALLGTGNDTWRGGAGNDVFTGSAAGRDFLDGGSGTDTLNWTWTGTAPLVLDMAQATKDTGGTSFTGFETYDLLLGDGNDTLSLQGLSAPLSGRFNTGQGDDTILIDHTTGAIWLDPGPGWDRIVGDFSQSSRVITESRSPGTGSVTYLLTTPEGVEIQLSYTPWKGVPDRPYAEVFDLTLSPGNDEVILGHSAVRAYLRGEEGDDILGGGRGDDVLDGGPGSDTVSLSGFMNTPIRLGVSTPQLTTQGTDTLLSIENLSGSGWFIGDNGANVLKGTGRFEGGGGDDTLIAYSGNDTLLGGAGNDSLSGGDGNDLLAGGGRHQHRRG